MSTVPDDAAALDVPCPHCGERPIEQAAKNVRLTGLLLLFSIKRDTQIGCAECTKQKSWKSAAITAVTGWWSVFSAILNPFAILWNLIRGPINRGPSAGLVEHVEETGIDVEFLSDPDEFDPAAHVQDEALVRGLVSLGCAVMLADGEADRAEAESVKEELAEITESFDEAELESLIDETARDAPTVHEIGDALNALLTEDGKDVAVGLAARVAAADGDVDDEEVELITEVGDELGMDLDEEEIESIVTVNAILDGDEPDELLGETPPAQ